MATFIILPNDVVEVQIGQVHLAQRVLNILHYQYKGSTTITDGDAEMLSLLNKIGTAPAGLVAAMKDCQVDTLQYSFMRGSIVAPTRQRYIHLTISGSGTVASGSMPPNVAGVVTKQGAVPGRGKSGRMSLGGVPISNVAGGAFTAGALLSYGTVAARVKAKVATATGGEDWHPVLWSPGTVGNPPLIVDAFAQPTTRVVRRRTVGQGI